MRNNETGEFELVVGNRQLLSGFFIVVLLFAVAFAMGYVVGQNSPKSLRTATEAASNAPVSLTPSDGRPQPAPATPPAAPPSGGAAATLPSTEAAGQPPAQAAAQTAPPAASVTPDSSPGSYWQVMAVPQADAEVVIRTLKDKGFPATLSQGPNNLMRVLVGPYSDRQVMGKAKTDLENLGLRPIQR